MTPKPEAAGEPPRTEVTLATRGSALALWQADFVAAQLQSHGIKVETLVVKTTADRVQDRFLHELGGKGLFIKELEEALTAKTADLAIHSLKDMPAVVPKGFALAAVLPRHSPCDAMIFRKDVAERLTPPAVLTAPNTASLGQMTVGTGSLRREAILKRCAPALTCEGVRGNVDTRLRKLAEGAWDALILAEASLDRLGIKDVARSRLGPDWFIPCASQGALAIESREGDDLGAWVGKTFGCPDTTLAVSIEREMLARLGGDCTLPFGCLVAKTSPAGETLHARAAVYGPVGDAAICEHAAPYGSAAAFDRAAFAETLARKLKDAGAAKILKALRLAVPPAFG